MKKLNYLEMETVEGGTSPAVYVADAACLAMGFSFGLVTFGLGLVAGVGCSMLVAYAANR